MKNFLLNIYFHLLAFFAKIYIKRTKPEVIGITGTIGKTSVRMILFQILQKYLPEKQIYTSSKNFNGELGMVFSIFQIKDYSPNIFSLLKVFSMIAFKSLFGKKKYDIILLEYGIDHIGEMDFLLNIVKPNIGVITKIDKVHSMKLKSPDIIAQEKFKMIEASKEIIFLNNDDPYCQSYTNENNVDKFFFATKKGEADINFENYKIFEEDGVIKTSFDFMLRGKKISEIKSNLVGEENAGYIGIGLTLLDIYFYKFYKKSFQNNEPFDFNLQLQPGRFSLFQGINGSIIFDSSYNASPFSMRKIIDNVYSIKKTLLSEYKMILVLGDMRELGDYAQQEHREIAGFISGVADYVFLVGENMITHTHDELTKIGFPKNNLFTFKKSVEAGKALKNFLDKSNDKFIILFKGSQNTIFLEEAIKFVLKDKSDERRLARQADFWIKKKKRFFNV